MPLAVHGSVASSPLDCQGVLSARLLEHSFQMWPAYPCLARGQGVRSVPHQAEAFPCGALDFLFSAPASSWLYRFLVFRSSLVDFPPGFRTEDLIQPLLPPDPPEPACIPRVCPGSCFQPLTSAHVTAAESGCLTPGFLPQPGSSAFP